MIRFAPVRKAILTDLPFWQNFMYLALAVAVPTAIRMGLGTRGVTLPFAPFFPVVLLTAIFLGWRWAVAGTFISALIVNRFFLADSFSSELEASDISMLALFWASCALLILTGETLRRTVRELDGILKHNEMLTMECHHRVKNVYGIILAIIRMADTNCTPQQYRESIEGRIYALSWANQILLSGPDETSSIRQIIS